MIDQETTPLTALQRGRLLFECLPFISFAVMVVIFLLVFQRLYETPPALIFWLFIVVVLVVLGYQTLQRLRDFISGVAIVERDVLENSYASRRSRYFWGRFQQLGRMRLMPKVHFQSSPGREYRVHYSPVSKIVWQLERVD